MDKLTKSSSLIEFYDRIVRNDPTLTTIDISKELYKAGVWSCNPKYKMIRGLLLFSLYKNNNIICVKLDNLLLKDCNLKRLIACDSIKELELEWNNLGNKSIVYLSKMKNLESLRIINSHNIKNLGLYPLIEMNNLRKLCICIYDNIDFDFLKYTRIKHLVIHYPYPYHKLVDNTNIIEISQSKKLKHLKIVGIFTIRMGIGVYYHNMFASLHNLRLNLSSLYISMVDRLSEAEVISISKLKYLTRFDIISIYSTSIELPKVKKYMIQQMLLNYNLRYVYPQNGLFDFSKHVNRNIHNHKIRITKLFDLLLQ